MRRSWILALWALALCPLLAFGEPKEGTVKLTDGRSFKGEIVESADSVEITIDKGTYKATVSFPRKQVLIVEYGEKPKPAEGGGEAATGEGLAELRTYTDYPGRYILSAPEGWTFTDSTHPAIRVEMRHEDEAKGCFFLISVNPADESYPAPQRGAMARETLRTMKDQVSAQARAVFGDASAPRALDVGTLFGSPVYETSYDLKRGDKEFTLTELRFERAGFEYVLRAGCRKEAFKDSQGWLWAAFESFSFIPPLEVSETHYLDYKVGYRVERPSKDWSFETDVFDDYRPVNMEHSSGKAWIRVEVLGKARSPGEIIDKAVEKFKSRPGGECEELKNGDGARDGVAAVYRIIRGFEERAVKAEEFYYFIAQRGEKILLIRGCGPTSGGEEKVLREQLTTFFDNLNLFDPEVSRDRLREASQATERYGTGKDLFDKRQFEAAIASYTEALALFPTFRAAYLGRAEANKELKRYDDYRADIEKVAEMGGDDEIDPKLKADLALSYYSQGEEAKKNKQYEKAVDFMVKAYKLFRDDSKIQAGYVDAHDARLRELLKAEDYRTAIKEMTKGERSFRSGDGMKALISDAYLGRADSYMDQGKFRQALNDAERAKKEYPKSRKADALIRRAESAIEKNR